MQSQGRRTKLAERIAELEVQFAVSKIELGKVERDNEQSNGGHRAEVILKRSLLAGQERELNEVREDHSAPRPVPPLHRAAAVTLTVAVAARMSLFDESLRDAKTRSCQPHPHVSFPARSPVVVQLKRSLQASIKQEESTWGAVMTVESAESLLTGKARGTGFGGVSKPAESACVRFFLTVKESLDARRQMMRARLAETTADWEERKRAMHSRAALMLQRYYKRRMANKAAALRANNEIAHLRAARREKEEREAAARAHAEALARMAEAERKRLLWLQKKDKAKQFMFILAVRLEARLVCLSFFWWCFSTRVFCWGV